MVNGAGIITTIAGTGTQGSSGDGGMATAAQLYSPVGVATDPFFNVYIADFYSHKIRVVTTNGPSHAVYVLGTVGIQPWGSISGNQAAQWIWSDPTATSGSYTNTDLWTFSGSFQSTSAYTGTIEVCVDDQATVYLNGQMIQSTNFFKVQDFKVTPAPPQSSISVIAGTNTIMVVAQNLPWNGPNNAGLLLSIKDNNGNYVYTTGTSWTFQKTPGYIKTLAGSGAQGSSGDGGAATSAQLYNPNGVAADASGNIFIADTNNNKIRLVTSAGIITTIAGVGTQGPSGDGGMATSAQLYSPYGVAVDSNGNFYIADFNNDNIRMVNRAGIIKTLAGMGVQGSSGDGGAATNAQLYHPAGVAVDSSGNVYFSDLGNHKIRMITTSGIIRTFTGTGIAGNSGDGGVATSAQLNYPTGVATDSSGGKIYIADDVSNTIRVVTTTGIPSYAPTSAPTRPPSREPTPAPTLVTVLVFCTQVL